MDVHGPINETQEQRLKTAALKYQRAALDQNQKMSLEDALAEVTRAFQNTGRATKQAGDGR